MTRRDAEGRSPAGWVTLALSILVVGALVAVALVEESRRGEMGGEPLEIVFDAERSQTDGERYYVPYTIMNTGPQAISSAEIWIGIYEGERLVESSEITVAFLPLEGRQDGLYVTTLDPATHTARGRLVSLQFP